MRGAAACAAILFLTGCSARSGLPFQAGTPPPRLTEDWNARARETRTLALLAQTEVSTPEETQSFTLELFFRGDDLYLLRGRGTLGITGFRARYRGDTVTVLLDRQQRGYEGPPESIPDEHVRRLWHLLVHALPWIVGSAPLKLSDEGRSWQVQTTADGQLSALRVTRGNRELVIRYGRYRPEYPFWHLREVDGRSPEGRLHLSVRQQLYNPALEPGIFELNLPDDIQPLVD